VDTVRQRCREFDERATVAAPPRLYRQILIVELNPQRGPPAKSVSWLPGRSDSIEGSRRSAGRTSRTVPRNASSSRINTGPLLVASGAVVGVGTVVVPSLDTVSSVVVTAEDAGEAGDAFAPVTADGAECFAAQPANRRTATAGPRTATRPTTRRANREPTCRSRSPEPHRRLFIRLSLSGPQTVPTTGLTSTATCSVMAPYAIRTSPIGEDPRGYVESLLRRLPPQGVPGVVLGQRGWSAT
jgi:hypothetical protein